MKPSAPGCVLCQTIPGTLAWEDEALRVVLIDDAQNPGLCRVIWKAHVGEMTELTSENRRHLMEVVFAVETVLRNWMEPDKINLASFGNQVPHLHWHVAPRWQDDGTFPGAAWAAIGAGPDEKWGPQALANAARSQRAMRLREILREHLTMKQATLWR